jgi:hypothetical protein
MMPPVARVATAARRAIPFLHHFGFPSGGVLELCFFNCITLLNLDYIDKAARAACLPSNRQSGSGYYAGRMKCY